MELPIRAATVDHEPFEEHVGWRGGLGAGVVATIVMGVGISLVDPGLLGDRIAGMYGVQEGLAAGWVAHLAHGALFGLLFAVVVADPTLANLGHRYPGSIVVGIVYGLILAVVGMGMIMPMWLQTVGSAGAPSIPFVDAWLLAWHLVFGVVLGAAFPLLDRW